MTVKRRQVEPWQSKYRPRKVAELDLPEVRSRLASFLAQDNLPQALLFFGPRGSGKTSAARIVARSLNCLKREGIEPCGDCSVCRGIEKGSCLDVVEIDAASNRGIDDIRRIKEKASLAPMGVVWKVYVIDEVHMLTKEAFNALLKLLEEPPKKVIFILCTTESQKIPETVLSRLYQIPFRKAKKEEVLASLEKVVQEEGLAVEREVLEEIAVGVDGSFRDAKKLLTQVAMEGRQKGKINREDLEQVMEGQGLGQEREFWELFKSDERVKILDFLTKLNSNGVDMAHFREKLLQQAQEFLLEAGEKQSLFLWVKCLLQAAEWERQTLLADLPLQLALLDFWAGGEKKVKEGKVEEKEKRKVEEMFVKRETEGKREGGGRRLGVKTEVEKIQSKEKRSKEGGEIQWGEEEWKRLLVAVKPMNHSVEAFLRSSRPLSLSGNCLTVEVFYPFHKERLEDRRNREIVENGLREVCGKEMKLIFVLGKRQEGGGKMLHLSGDQARMARTEEGGDLYSLARSLF